MKQLISIVSLILLSIIPLNDPDIPLLRKNNGENSFTLFTDHPQITQNISEEKFNASEKVSIDMYSRAAEKILTDEYNISFIDEMNSYQTTNRPSNFHFTFHKDGFTAKPLSEVMPPGLKDSKNKSIKNNSIKIDNDWKIILSIRNYELGISELNVKKNTAEIESGKIRIEYTNSSQGLRQDFIIKEKPDTERNLELILNAETELEMNVRRDQVLFSSITGDKMKYTSLNVFDVNGKTLDAFFEKRNEKEFAIVVNDIEADYPVTVDPLSLSPDWEAVCDQEWSRYGDCISSGDLNGDGFDDVAVSAPAYEPGGAVFIYYGSSSGPSVLPDKIIYGDGIGFGNRVTCEGDFNNDGYYDLIIGVPFEDSGKVKLYLGSATGIKDTADWVSISYGGINFGLMVSSGGDVNGDGYDDLIASVQYYLLDSHHVGALVFLGSAEGLSDSAGPAWTASIFSPPDYSFGGNVSISGDVNGDGFDDAVVSDADSRKVFVYLGSADRQMFDPPEITLSQNIYDFGFAACIAKDINGDGYDEICIGDRESSLYLYYGSAAGPSQNYNLSLSACSYRVSSAGDFNNDGYNDILVSTCDLPGVNIYFGSITGLNNIPVQLNVECYSLASGDINGDGISDALVSREPRAYGFFGPADYIIPKIVSFFPVQNSVSVNIASDISVVFNQNMDASTLNSSNIIITGSYSGSISADINYNAASKTLTLDPSTDFKTGEKISVTFKSGIKSENNIRFNPFIYSFITEVTGSTENYQISEIIYDSYNVESGDIDRDGDVDLIIFNIYTGLKIMKNNGSGHFSYFSAISDGTGNFMLSDLDLDGDLDIVFGALDNTIKYYINDGTGIFTFMNSSPGNLSKKTGDFDGDGDFDMAAILSGIEMAIYRNDNGIFTLTSTITLPFECSEPQYYNLFDYEIDDMDSDGDLDIIEVQHRFWTPFNYIFGCKYLVLFRNDGSGNFNAETIISESFSGNYSLFDVCYVTPFNFDGDNDEDILLYNSKLTNSGNTGFNISPSVWFIDKPNTADIDGDGDLDFINTYDGKIFKNDGAGNFTNTGILTSNEKLIYADF
ncbi:MAG: VCBS repeat-containing protein, partial [Bacteroidetes bacterium]|nr:VCBS repeat-containing protein [Bacteroidota bacterium]